MNQGNAFRDGMRGGLPNEQYRTNPYGDDRHMPMEPMMGGPSHAKNTGMYYEPEQLRPLETCESNERRHGSSNHQGMHEPGRSGFDNYGGPKGEQENDGKEEEEEDDDSDDDTSYCKLCDMRFDNLQKYYTHTRSMLHAQRQMAASTSRTETNQKPSQPASQPANQSTPQPSSQPAARGEQAKKEPEKEEEEEEDDTSFCKVCNVPFDSVQKYYQHTRGLLHIQRQLEADKVKLAEAAEKQALDQQKQQQQPGASEDKKAMEEEEWEEEWEEQPKNSSEMVCELCDIKTTGIQAFQAHEIGRSHKTVAEAVENGTVVPQRIFGKLGPNAKIPDKCKPLTAAIMDLKPFSGPSVLLDLLKNVPEAVVGTAYVKEGRTGKNPTFLCMTCESMCDAAGIMSHMIGAKHRMKYLRDKHPSLYEHVKSHGGKKSQLSAFLEEICCDVEKKEGRKEPIMDRPGKNMGDSGDNSKDEEKTADTEEAGDKKASEKREPSQQRDKPDRKALGKGKLPHDLAMAKYREERLRGSGPDMRGPNRWDGPPRGWGGPDGPRGWDGPPGSQGGPPGGWGGHGESFRFSENRGFGPPPPDYPLDPYDRMCGPGPGPYPPYRDFPPEPLSEEERLQRMYDYEAFLLNNPMLFVSPEEARHRMFDEYERLGVPFDIARDRVLIQEDRQMKLIAYMREGLSLKEAQVRLRKVESRKQLIREYERQGLDSKEARWRVVLEEERANLNDKYEQLGYTPLQIRAKIMAGEDRMHLVQEFERQGMMPEEALKRALWEEDRLKDTEKMRGEQSLDDVTDRQMLETYMGQGDSREQAENKVIAVLRRQGVPTEDAIIRVQNIQVRPLQERARSPEKMQRLPDRGRQKSPVRERKRSLDRDRRRSPEGEGRKSPERGCSQGHSSKAADSFDNITPEVAKERLFQEYEKRGVPREKARLALIQELVRSGVSEEEAERRFSTTRPIAQAEGERKRKKQDGHRRNRSRSPASSAGSSSHKRRRRSPSADRGSRSSRSDRERHGREVRDFKSLQEHRDFKALREGRDWKSYREARDERLGLREETFPSHRRGKDFDRGPVASKEQRDGASGRITLTLGEEIKLKARQLKREEFLKSRLEEKLSSSGEPAAQKAEPDPKEKLSDLLESLTDNLISSEGNESVAMSMSKALTSALMKYRADPIEEKAKPSVSKPVSSSFVEKRIQDAKKLFASKMGAPNDSTPGHPGSGFGRGYGQQAAQDQHVSPRSLRPESFGLPPPLPIHARQQAAPASSSYMSYHPPYSQNLSQGYYPHSQTPFLGYSHSQSPKTYSSGPVLNQASQDRKGGGSYMR